jgi:hypothetical protein
LKHRIRLRRERSLGEKMFGAAHWELSGQSAELAGGAYADCRD